MMNRYIAYWQDKSFENIYAETSLEAQQKAVILFQRGTRKRVKSYDITIMLAEKNGEQVIHTPVE